MFCCPWEYPFSTSSDYYEEAVEDTRIEAEPDYILQPESRIDYVSYFIFIYLFIYYRFNYKGYSMAEHTTSTTVCTDRRITRGM